MPAKKQNWLAKSEGLSLNPNQAEVGWQMQSEIFLKERPAKKSSGAVF